MYSEGLGRLYNIIAPATGVYINMRDCAGISFIGFEVDGATQFQLTFAADAAGTGAVTPNVIDHFYGRSNDQASGVWIRSTMTLGSLVTAADVTQDEVCIEVSAAMCPDGKPWVKLTGDGSSTVTAVLHDLAYNRAPQNLRSVIA
jgi:hypothetical protein